MSCKRSRTKPEMGFNKYIMTVMVMSVCLSVCLSVRLTVQLASSSVPSFLSSGYFLCKDSQVLLLPKMTTGHLVTINSICTVGRCPGTLPWTENPICYIFSCFSCAKFSLGLPDILQVCKRLYLAVFILLVFFFFLGRVA